MPFPNEHAARQADPDQFEKLRRGTIDGAPEGVSVIFGVKSDGESEIQSVRADAGKVSVSDFRAYLEAADLKSSIEEATKEEAEGFAEEEEEDEEEKKSDAPFGGKKAASFSGYWGAALCLEGEWSYEDEPSSWVEIVRSGTFFGSSGPKPRRVELTEEDILSMVRNYETVLSEKWFNGGAPVGYNHASSFGGLDPESTKAAARISAVEVRPNKHDGLSLWGLFSWTADGARRIRSRDFSSISAELIPPDAATSKLSGSPMGGWCLVGATLTNTPFVPGMQTPELRDTLAASERVQRIHLTDQATKEAPKMSEKRLAVQTLSEVLGTPEAEVLAEVRRLQTEAAKVSTLAEALEEATNECESLRTRSVELEDREKDRVLDAACASGRIAPTQRDVYWDLIKVSGEEAANRLFTEGRIPVTQDTPEAPAADTGDVVDAFEVVLDRLLSEGKTPAQAWDAARLSHGSTLYGTAEN